MTLKDIKHLLTPEAYYLVGLLESLGQVLEEAGDSVTDLGWDFRKQQAEMAFEQAGKGRMEMTLRYIDG